jgi:hypothetical protein
VIARAPPTITIVETAEAAAEMTAMETMTAALVAATKAVTTPAHAAPTVAATAHAATAVATTATTAATHQDQRTARRTRTQLSRTQLLGVAGITRQSRQCSGGGKSQRESANKTRRDRIAFHDCVPFVGHMWASKLLTECMAAPLSGVSVHEKGQATLEQLL